MKCRYCMKPVEDYFSISITIKDTHGDFHNAGRHDAAIDVCSSCIGSDGVTEMLTNKAVQIYREMASTHVQDNDEGKPAHA